MLDDSRLPEILRSFSGKKWGLLLRQESLAALNNRHGWLDDEVINVYFKLLEHRSTIETNDSPRLLFVSSFMCRHLEDEDRSGTLDLSKVCKKLFEKRDHGVVRSADWLYVPVHRGGGQSGHWVLLMASVKTREIEVYDPYHTHYGLDFEFVSLFRKVLLHLGQSWAEYTGPWTVLSKGYNKEIEVQKDGWNCGLFICAYADAHSSNALGARASPLIGIMDIRRLRRTMRNQFEQLQS